MGTITAIVAQEKVRAHLGPRVNVWIEGQFALAVSLEVAQRCGLRIGFLVDEATLARLREAENEQLALARALRFLGFRARSRAEIAARLGRHGHDEAVVARVLERLEGVGLIDDAGFAHAWVAARSNSKPRGSRLLRDELRRKGLDRDQIEAALPEDQAEQENALVALRAIERKLSGLEGRERERKAVEMLGRRGFGWSIAKAALRRLDGEE